VSRWRSKVTSLMACGVLFVGGCATRHADPRAYPGSRDKPLEQVLLDFSLQLPPCDLSGLRYFATDDLQGTFYFKVTVSADCAEQYLAKLGMNNGEAKVGVPFIGEYAKQKFGWSFPDRRPCECYRRYLSERVEVSVAVDDSGVQRTIYVQATGG
jgi:hypothetical protein